MISADDFRLESQLLFLDGVPGDKIEAALTRAYKQNGIGGVK